MSKVVESLLHAKWWMLSLLPAPPPDIVGPRGHRAIRAHLLCGYPSYVWWIDDFVLCVRVTLFLLVDFLLFRVFHGFFFRVFLYPPTILMYVIYGMYWIRIFIDFHANVLLTQYCYV